MRDKEVDKKETRDETRKWRNGTVVSWCCEKKGDATKSERSTERV